MSVTPPGPRNRFLWADPGACLPPGKAPPQRLLGLSFPVSSMIKKAKQNKNVSPQNVTAGSVAACNLQARSVHAQTSFKSNKASSECSGREF